MNGIRKSERKRQYVGTTSLQTEKATPHKGKMVGNQMLDTTIRGALKIYVSLYSSIVRVLVEVCIRLVCFHEKAVS